MAEKSDTQRQEKLVMVKQKIKEQEKYMKDLNAEMEALEHEADQEQGLKK